MEASVAQGFSQPPQTRRSALALARTHLRSRSMPGEPWFPPSCTRIVSHRHKRRDSAREACYPNKTLQCPHLRREDVYNKFRLTRVGRTPAAERGIDTASAGCPGEDAEACLRLAVHPSAGLPPNFHDGNCSYLLAPRRNAAMAAWLSKRQFSMWTESNQTNPNNP
jgi:hypothetical protein